MKQCGIDDYDCRVQTRRKRNHDQCDHELYWMICCMRCIFSVTIGLVMFIMGQANIHVRRNASNGGKNGKRNGHRAGFWRPV